MELTLPVKLIPTQSYDTTISTKYPSRIEVLKRTISLWLQHRNLPYYPNFRQDDDSITHLSFNLLDGSGFPTLSKEEEKEVREIILEVNRHERLKFYISPLIAPYRLIPFRCSLVLAEYDDLGVFHWLDPEIEDCYSNFLEQKEDEWERIVEESVDYLCYDSPEMLERWSLDAVSISHWICKPSPSWSCYKFSVDDYYAMFSGLPFCFGLVDNKIDLPELYHYYVGRYLYVSVLSFKDIQLISESINKSFPL